MSKKYRNNKKSTAPACWRAEIACVGIQVGGCDGEPPVPTPLLHGYEKNVFGITLSYKLYDLWINRHFIK